MVTVNVDGHPSSPTLDVDIKVSLRTKSPAEAKRLAQEAQAEFDRIWLSFENGPVRLTLRQITALACEMYHIIRAVPDRVDAEKRRAASRFPQLLIPMPSLDERLRSWVDGVLSEHHLVADDYTRQRMLSVNIVSCVVADRAHAAGLASPLPFQI
jgi:hypothetical protein